MSFMYECTCRTYLLLSLSRADLLCSHLISIFSLPYFIVIRIKSSFSHKSKHIRQLHSGENTSKKPHRNAATPRKFNLGFLFLFFFLSSQPLKEKKIASNDSIEPKIRKQISRKKKIIDFSTQHSVFCLRKNETPFKTNHSLLGWKNNVNQSILSCLC